MGRLRRSADRSGHGVMVSQGRGLRALRCTHVLLRRVRPAGRCGHRSIADALAGLVRRVVEKCTNVVHKQGVKKLCNLLLVGEIQRAIKRYPASGQPSESKVGTISCLPDTLEMHRSNLDHMSRLLALKNTVAATAGHASDIEKLGPVDKVIVLASCDTNAIRLHLEAQATFVLPQGRRHSRLHTWRCYLARSIVRLLRVLLISARRRLHIGCHGWQWK